MPINAKSFADLVDRICRERHENNLYAMRARCRIPYSTLLRWIRGEPESYRMDRVAQFCGAYGLKLDAVWTIIQADQLLRVKGQSPFVPDRSDVRRGPKPMKAGSRRRHVARRIASVVVGFAATLYPLWSLGASGRIMSTVRGTPRAWTDLHTPAVA